MNYKFFLETLERYLKSIKIGNQYGSYLFANEPDFSYGSPIGGWDASKYKGFRFIHVSRDYDFIVRPIQEHGYLVIESVSSQSQLANVDLSKQSKYNVQGNQGSLIEDYTMTVGLGRRRVNEVKSEFKKLGFNQEGIITQFNTKNIDFSTLLIEIFKWAEIRQEVKYEIQKKIQSKKNDHPKETVSEANLENQDPIGVLGKGFTYRDKKDIEPTLGVKSIAEKLAIQIKKLKDEEGQVIGIFGRWGRGKTFLIREFVKNLGYDYDNQHQTYRSSDDFFIVKIHAWKYKEENAFWAYLYESIADEYYNSTRFKIISKPAKILKLNIYRLGWIKFIWLLIPALLSLGWWLLPTENKSSFLGWLINSDLKWDNLSNVYKSILVLTPISLSTYLFAKNVTPNVSKLFTTISKKHHFKNELGFQAKVQDELKTLLQTWISKKDSDKRVLIIVDDLDRCDLKNILPIADALRIILEDAEIIGRTIVITLVDENILMNAISKKYENLGEDSNNIRAKEYMDKLFLTGVKLPDLIDTEKKNILDALTEGHIYEISRNEKVHSDPKSPILDNNVN